MHENPRCPTCGREGHHAGGIERAKWINHRETLTLADGRTVHRYGERLAGSVNLICLEGHRWSTERPAHMTPKRAQRARPKRGFY